MAAETTQSPNHTSPSRVAVLGCGRLAREVVLPTLARIPTVDVAVVADPDQAARDATVPHAPNAKALADWRDAVASDIDAIVVALPTAMHAQAALAAIEAGRHLYLEKPIAATVEEGTALVDAFAGLKPRREEPPHAGLKPRRHLVVSVGFNYRFNPLIDELWRRVQRGEIGAPRLIRTAFSTRATPGGWRRPDAPGGGVLLDLGSHHIDLVRHITADEVAAVSCVHEQDDDGAERAALQMQLAGGAIVQSTFATGGMDDDRIEIAGELGTLAVDRYRALTVDRRGPGAPSRLHSLTAGLRDVAGGWRYALEKRSAPWHEPSFARALHAFTSAIAGAPPGGADLVDGLQSLRVVDAARRSAADGRLVAVDAGVPEAAHAG